MRKRIRFLFTATICVLLSVSMLFPKVNALEVEGTTETTVTDTSSQETYPEETTNCEIVPTSRSSEPDVRNDVF